MQGIAKIRSSSNKHSASYNTLPVSSSKSSRGYINQLIFREKTQKKQSKNVSLEVLKNQLMQ
jgi:hypothetical protein